MIEVMLIVQKSIRLLVKRRLLMNNLGSLFATPIRHPIIADPV